MHSCESTLPGHGTRGEDDENFIMNQTLTTLRKTTIILLTASIITRFIRITIRIKIMERFQQVIVLEASN